MKLARLSDVAALEVRTEPKSWSIRRSAFFILGCSAAVWLLVVYAVVSLF